MDLLLTIVLFFSSPTQMMIMPQPDVSPVPITPCDSEYRESIDAINQSPWLSEGEKIMFRQMAEMRLQECRRQAAEAEAQQRCERIRKWKRLLEYNGYPPNTPAFVLPANLPEPPSNWRPDYPYPPCW